MERQGLNAGQPLASHTQLASPHHKGIERFNPKHLEMFSRANLSCQQSAQLGRSKSALNSQSRKEEQL